MTKRFDFFQLFSTVLKRFKPGHSKKNSSLVLAHLEPKIELFEVDDIGDDGTMICSTIISQTANSSSSGSR